MQYEEPKELQENEITEGEQCDKDGDKFLEQPIWKRIKDIESRLNALEGK